MNTGQQLVLMSGLSTRTALEHLRAIQVGTGPGQTIFASRFSVITGEDRFTVMRKAKRQAPSAEPVQRPATQPKATKHAFARTQAQGITVSTQVDAIAVIQKTQSVVATRDLGTVTINRRKGVK